MVSAGAVVSSRLLPLSLSNLRRTSLFCPGPFGVPPAAAPKPRLPLPDASPARLCPSTELSLSERCGRNRTRPRPRQAQDQTEEQVVITELFLAPQTTTERETNTRKSCWLKQTFNLKVSLHSLQGMRNWSDVAHRWILSSPQMTRKAVKAAPRI